MGRFITMIISFLLASNAVADKNQDHKIFEKIFSEWTYAFNHKDLNGSCNLFSKDLIASYQGVPKKTYASVCDGFKKIFKSDLNYQYQFKLHQVYRSQDLAAVRLTWYLKISENGKLISDTQDEGLDVFKKNSQGEWKIVNYLGYPYEMG